MENVTRSSGTVRTLVGSTCASALALVACHGGDDRVDRSPLVWEGPAAIVRANCCTCHGLDLTGGTSWVDASFPAPPIAGYPSAIVEIMVRDGAPHMMPSIPEQEIPDAALVALGEYIETLPGGAVPDPAHDVTVRVLDEDPWFDPPQIEVPRGAVVRFLNGGRTYHPVVDLAHIHSNGLHGWSSHNLGPGGMWFRSFDEPGTHVVLCGHHPYMQGKIHVGTPVQPLVYAPNPPSALPTVPGQGEVWVLAQFQDWPGRATDGVVQVIDAATWTVTHLIPVGNNPHNLWFSADGGEALVTSWFDTHVSTIDAVAKAVTAAYPIGPTPAHVTSDHAGSRWFVSIEGSHYVQSCSQTLGPEGLDALMIGLPRAVLSGYGPHGIWYAPGRLVTANSIDATFSIVDTQTMTELARLPTGMLPLGAGADSTATYASAGNYVDASVSLYDLQNLAWIRDIPLPGSAVQAPFTPDDHKIVVANGQGVSVVDVAKAADPVLFPDPEDAIDATIPTGRGAHGVAFGRKAGGGMYAYVTHKFENYVSVVDLTTLTKAGDVPLTLTTSGHVSVAGVTDTGGNGIAVRPNPPPWR